MLKNNWQLHLPVVISSYDALGMFGTPQEAEFLSSCVSLVLSKLPACNVTKRETIVKVTKWFTSWFKE